VSTDRELLIKILEKITQKQNWTQSDVLISSSTIFSLFGFGSIVALKLDAENRVYVVGMFRILLACIFATGFAHVFIMVSVIDNFFNQLVYELLMIMTIVSFGLILFSLHEILTAQPQPRVKELEPVAQIAIQMLDQLRK